MNKTDSAVRITHMPSGIVVAVQNERSQSANKETAMKILRSRLAEKAEEEREAELARERGGVSMGFGGNAIRSYVLHPYQQVKDARTGTRSATRRASSTEISTGSFAPISCKLQERLVTRRKLR